MQFGACQLCIYERKKGANSYVIETLRRAFLLSEVSHELSRATPEAERKRVSRHMNWHLCCATLCAIWACPHSARCNLGLSPSCTLFMDEVEVRAVHAVVAHDLFGVFVKLVNA